jgi:heat shock protein HslJ
LSLRRRTLCAALALVALTSGCGGSGGQSPSSASGGGTLTGRQWVLDTGTLGVSGAGSVSSFIRFEDGGKVTGNDGCNQFAGSYRSDGAKLTFGPLAGTQMGCPGTAGEVAQRVTSALGRVQRYAVTGTTLALQDAGGAALLSYREGRPGVAGAWDVTSVLYDDGIRSVIGGTTLTATFASDGRVSGSSGCNTFHGPYEEQGTALRIGPLTSTRKACTGPDGAHAQERGYLAALESVVRFEQAGTRLTLLNAKGQMAVTLERSG